VYFYDGLNHRPQETTPQGIMSCSYDNASNASRGRTSDSFAPAKPVPVPKGLAPGGPSMKRFHILLVLRCVAFTAAAGFLAVKARDYLESEWDTPTLRLLYGVLGCLLIWIVTSLSTRRLFRELMADAEVSRWQIAASQFKDSEGRTYTVHRYPWLLKYPVAAFGLIYVALPYLNAEPGKSIALVTYVLCFGLAFFSLSVAFYMFSYSVTLTQDGILVHAFGKREIAFSDVADTKLVRTAYGRQIVVTLNNGQLFRFGGKLTGFFTLLDALIAHTPTEPLNTNKVNAS
jgi:hypothetical protein